jgi:hypothetical protein
LYADDTVIYYADKTAKEVEITLQNDIDKVSDWLEENKLLLNQKKTNVILFGTKPKLNKVNTFSILLKGQEIARVVKFKYLGIIFDQCMTWREHVESAGGEVMKRLGLLSRIRNSLTLQAAKCVYNTIIQPIFDYFDISWGAMLQTCNTEMQRLQNRATHIVVKSNRTENCFPSLKWLHLSTRRKVHRCILIFQICKWHCTNLS